MFDEAYQRGCHELRPSDLEMAYIEREVAIGLANTRAGWSVGPSAVKIGIVSEQMALSGFRGATPLYRIYPCMRTGCDWTSNDRSLMKAYVLACFCELAYLRLSEMEIPGRERYKIFPICSSASSFSIRNRSISAP